MKISRRIIGLMIAMLFTALSVAAMPIAPTAAHQAEFFPHQEAVIAEHTNVRFEARAPPMAVANVAFTGAAVAEHGNGIIIHGHETHVAGLDFGIGFVATNSVGGTNIRAVDPSAANAGDRLPPYNPNAPIRDFDADGTTTYVRVYTEGQTGQQGSWMMRPSEIERLSPQQIQDKFDLPYTPTHVTDVTPPAGTPIRTGTVNEGNIGGNGGGTQFELVGDDYIPSGSFTNPRPLQ